MPFDTAARCAGQEKGRMTNDGRRSNRRRDARRDDRAGARSVGGGAGGQPRRRAGTGFAYRDPAGHLIRDRAILRRIKALAVPPAWTDVWICPYTNGHIQAVGRDARRRKQYRYHARWRSVRDEAKYGRLLLIADVLPRIRARVAADLAGSDLSRTRVLAALVRLLEVTLARIGNEEYARENKSFGLTTLRSRHARVRGGSVELDFRGKHGIAHHLAVRDTRLARLVRRCQDLPGQELFQYLDKAGERHAVASHDVNDYLREIAGEEVTAKDFRTWAATNLMALALRECAAAASEAAARRNVLSAIETVAKLLGNTPAICRKCYIHPAIMDGYLDGSLLAALTENLPRHGDHPGLKPEEAAVTAFLRARLGAAPGVT
jgi:DNA topoisomerase I